MKYFRQLIFPLVAIIAAFLVGAVVIFAIGDDPIYTYRLLIQERLSCASPTSV